MNRILLSWISRRRSFGPKLAELKSDGAASSWPSALETPGGCAAERLGDSVAQPPATGPRVDLSGRPAMAYRHTGLTRW
jgi:hypothetical protein